MSEEVTLKFNKNQLWKYTTFILLAVVVILVIVMVAGRNSPSNNNTNTQTQVTTGQQQADTETVDFQKVIADDSPSTGKKDAPVTILEFTDFSCPYCAAASGDNPSYTGYMQQNQPGWQPPVSNVIKDYVATGKVRLVAFYTMGHSGGHPAQNVAWCLNEQNPQFYWKFYTQAFANVEKAEDAATMRSLASNITGVDLKKLDACIAADKFQNRFTQEQALGAQLGVSGTPGFIVGKSDGSAPATIIRGAYPYSTFQQAIEANL